MCRRIGDPTRRARWPRSWLAWWPGRTRSMTWTWSATVAWCSCSARCTRLRRWGSSCARSPMATSASCKRSRGSSWSSSPERRRCCPARVRSPTEGQFDANNSWLTCIAIAHNLTRAAATLAGRRYALARPAHHPPPPDQPRRPNRPPRPRPHHPPAPALALATPMATTVQRRPPAASLSVHIRHTAAARPTRLARQPAGADGHQAVSLAWPPSAQGRGHDHIAAKDRATALIRGSGLSHPVG